MVVTVQIIQILIFTDLALVKQKPLSKNAFCSLCYKENFKTKQELTFEIFVYVRKIKISYMFTQFISGQLRFLFIVRLAKFQGNQ